jgi:hypothetical protein
MREEQAKKGLAVDRCAFIWKDAKNAISRFHPELKGRAYWERVIKCYRDFGGKRNGEK